MAEHWKKGKPRAHIKCSVASSLTLHDSSTAQPPAATRAAKLRCVVITAQCWHPLHAPAHMHDEKERSSRQSKHQHAFPFQLSNFITAMQQLLLLQAQIWLRFFTAAEGTLSTPCTCNLFACFTRGWLLRDQLENCLV